MSINGVLWHILNVHRVIELSDNQASNDERDKVQASAP